jgi:hypothetical protein
MDVKDKADHAYKLFEELTTAMMNEVTANNTGVSNTLYVGINAVAGALRPVAALIGFNPVGKTKVDDEDVAVEAADSYKPPGYLGNPWFVDNTPTKEMEGQPHFLN